MVSVHTKPRLASGVGAVSEYVETKKTQLTLPASLVPTATPSTPAVSNVLINPSLIGSKNILITTNMVSQNTGGESLKRKHEDEDDYDTL